MNCYILCKECGEKVKRQYKVDLPIDGSSEHVEIVFGKLIEDTKCDGCQFEKILKAGDQAYAMTSWSDSDEKPYIPWEHEVMEVDKSKDGQSSLCHDCDNIGNFPACLGNIDMKCEGEPKMEDIHECINFHPIEVENFGE